MKKKIGLIFNGGWSIYCLANAPKYKDIYELVYVHDFSWEAIKDFEAIVIPFLSNQDAITAQKDAIYKFLGEGKKVFVEGDTIEDWMDAKWEDRPTNNYWWVEDPTNPPISDTDHTHPVYQHLEARHACWHTHGAYTRLPKQAEVIQRNGEGEVITWQTKEYGGVLFATTLDPYIEHGIQQITHLDNYVDPLTKWLCGDAPGKGKLTFDRSLFGVDTLEKVA